MENIDFVNRKDDFLSSVKQKVYDWKDRLRDRHMLTLVVGLIVIIVALGLYIYKNKWNIDKHQKINIIWHFMSW